MWCVMNKTLLVSIYTKNIVQTVQNEMLNEGKKSIKIFWGSIAFLLHSLLVFYNGPN